MKEKIKNMLLPVSIFYVVMVVILMVFRINNFVTTLELIDSEGNKNKLNEYKEDLSRLDKNDCTNLIGSIIKHYEETSYDGMVKIKDMHDYDMNNGFLNFYLKLKEVCPFTEEILNEYNLPVKFVTTSIQRDELYQRYYFQYELSFVDTYMRDIVAASLNNIEYNINRGSELEIIKNLIQIYSEGEINNE